MFKIIIVGLAQQLISSPPPRQLLRTEIEVINVVYFDVAVVVQFYPWFNLYFLLLALVSNSLSYITIPKNKRKENLNQIEG